MAGEGCFDSICGGSKLPLQLQEFVNCYSVHWVSGSSGTVITYHVLSHHQAEQTCKPCYIALGEENDNNFAHFKKYIYLKQFVSAKN